MSWPAGRGDGDHCWSTVVCVAWSAQMCSKVAVSTHKPWQRSHSISAVSPTSTSRITPLQAAQRVVRTAAVSVRARRAPHFGQYTEPANITAKQAGQLTAASAAWQYLQLWSPGPAGAPQFGQWSEIASPVIWCSYNTPTMGLMDFIKGEFIDVIEW